MSFWQAPQGWLFKQNATKPPAKQPWSEEEEQKHPRAQGRFTTKPGGKPAAGKPKGKPAAKPKPEKAPIIPFAPGRAHPTPIRAGDFARFSGIDNLPSGQKILCFGALQQGYERLRGFGLQPTGMALMVPTAKALQKPPKLNLKTGNQGAPKIGAPQRAAKPPPAKPRPPLDVFFRVKDARPLKGKKINTGKLFYANQPMRLHVTDGKQSFVTKPYFGTDALFKPDQAEAPKFFPLKYASK